MMLSKVGALALASLIALGACSGDSEPADEWQNVHSDLSAALLSVWGSSSSDVWAVGADMRDGTGPLVIHYDGTAWERVETGETQGSLWWVFGFAGGPVYMSGDGGVILRYETDGTFTKTTTPGTETVFGLWGASPDDVWAVGGASENAGGFAWRLSGGDTWTDEPSLPADVPTSSAVWKLYGTATDDVWLVGSNGVALHWDGSTLSRESTGVGSSLFTVHSNGTRFAAVGGLASGIITEYDGTSWADVTPTNAPGLAGVCLDGADEGVAVGSFGAVYTRTSDGWAAEDLGFFVDQNLHGVWIDPDGGAWAVGGQTLAPPLTDGVLIHRGAPVAEGGI